MEEKWMLIIITVPLCIIAFLGGVKINFFYSIITYITLFWTPPQKPTPKPCNEQTEIKSLKKKNHETKLQINLILITSIEFNTEKKNILFIKKC